MPRPKGYSLPQSPHCTEALRRATHRVTRMHIRLRLPIRALHFLVTLNILRLDRIWVDVVLEQATTRVGSVIFNDDSSHGSRGFSLVKRGERPRRERVYYNQKEEKKNITKQRRTIRIRYGDKIRGGSKKPSRIARRSGLRACLPLQRRAHAERETIHNVNQW